jgi:Arc/MetJ-type ribon-helix-helix transcriptional regulator
MSTMNISLPADQISFIDDLVIQLGYANRSELMRSIVRLIKKEPKVLEPLSSLTLNPPSTKNGDEIMTSFRATGLYSEEFLKDLEDGINNSDYFTKTSHSK